MAPTPSHRILLIEDDADDQFFFMDALGLVASGLQCQIAHDGVEALRHLDTFELPSLIFLDLNMPRMNGYECLSRIRESAAKDVPVVVISTSTNPRDKKRVKELGASIFLEKSGDHKKLRGQLAEIFSTFLV